MSTRFNIAGTGHRPPVLFEGQKFIYDRKHQEVLIKFAEIALKAVLKKHNKEKAGIISGMAQGWDNALAHAAINLNLPLLAAVPFEGMESKWPEESKEDFKYLLSKAAKVHIVCEGGYEPKKFYLRDKYMVDNADLVLACHNGSTEGGTAITVKYANEVQRPIENCWTQWEKYWNESLSSV